jgi:hypothetical protein
LAESSDECGLATERKSRDELAELRPKILALTKPRTQFV